MAIKELPYKGEMTELFQREELPLVELTKLLNEKPHTRARALIVADDSVNDHALFKAIVGSKFYKPHQMTITLLSPEDKNDLIAQVCKSNRCQDYIFIDTVSVGSTMALTSSEAHLLKSDAYYF